MMQKVLIWSEVELWLSKQKSRMLKYLQLWRFKCEKWAKEKGCSEFASDCQLVNEESLRFHMALGFEEANRIICLRKDIQIYMLEFKKFSDFPRGTIYNILQDAYSYDARNKEIWLHRGIMNQSGLRCMTESRMKRKVPIQAITCIMRQ